MAKGKSVKAEKKTEDFVQTDIEHWEGGEPNPAPNPLVLAVDFDGVLRRYDGVWDGDEKINGGLIEGAADFLYEATQRFTVAIYSVRSATEAGRFAMRDWLQEKVLAELGEIGAQVVEHVTFPEHKPFASLMIDDRCYRFEGNFPSWKEIETLMQKPFAVNE